MTNTKKAPSPKVKQLSVQFDSGRKQSYTYLEVCEAVGHKLRVTIHIDSSYRDQCNVNVCRWDGSAWHQVHRILPNALQTTKNAYSPTPPVPADVALDRDELLRVAIAVIG